MTEVGHLVGAKTNKSAETMKEVIKFEAELAKVKIIYVILFYSKAESRIHLHILFFSIATFGAV